MLAGSTDYGTVILHAVIVVCFAVLVATGLRIAADDPDSEWIAALDPVLPVGNLWYNHLLAGLGLATALAAYACYIVRARLTTRVKLDKARLLTILRPGRTRWSALNVLVYWLMITALATEIVTGVMLFSGSGLSVLEIHRDATFVCLGSVVAHIVLHACHGGLGQLFRIVRPAPLHIAPPQPDLAELLAEQLALNNAARETLPDAVEPIGETSGAEAGDFPNVIDHQRAARRTVKLNAHPLVMALAVALAVSGIAVGAEQASRPTLVVAEIASAEAPRLDGDLSDPAWTKARPAFALTTQGGDFGGSHQSMVEVRAMHDGEFVYFAFVWEDPTRSLKHQPLIKRGGRWHVAASRADLADEGKYHEDKFSVLLAQPGLPLIGAAIHLARQPLSNMPPSSTGRGLHYTDGSIADVWQWRASHGGPFGHIDNCHFGGPAPPLQPGEAAKSHYSGGFALDPGTVPHQTNFLEGTSTADTAVTPRRLPRDPSAIAQAMGRISDASGESEAEGARWWMTVGESVPFSPALDAKIADGTVIPGILVPNEAETTRTSIRGMARWAAGRWTLELARRVHTGSPYDIPIKSGVLMWVAAFDHAEKRHTRHLRPFRLEVE